MKKDGSIKLVKSAIRTLNLFALFAEKKRPLSLGDIAEGMDAPKSSCHELLQTLVHLGYVLVIEGGKSYYPSRRLSELTDQIGQFNPVKEKIQNELRHLRDITGETVFIGRLQGDQVVYTEVFDGTHSVRYNTTSGDLKNLHASALGKALLASLDEPEQSQLISRIKLTRYNDNTITRKKDLKDNLLAGSREGIFSTFGEHLAEVMGLACPVNVQGHLLAIGLAGPIPRMQQHLATYSRALLAAQAEINR